jgi:Bifunctional DNA primase/polymerase, N-terminal
VTADTQYDDFEELPEHEPSWRVLERATKCRKQLLAAGYWPLPVNGKEPTIAGWSNIAATNKIINSWTDKYPDATNTGMLTRETPVIDIDITHPEAAAAVEALAREHFEELGRILVRFGRAPKRAIPLRTDEPFKKITGKFTALDGSAQQIEIMGNGQQVVVFGTHPETGRDYSWHGGEPGKIKRKELPDVCKADAQTFLDAATELLIRDFGFKTNDKRKANGGDQQSSDQPPDNTEAAGIRGKAYAQAALEGCTEELAAATSGSRNELLNKLAFRLGRMIARGWIDRADVEAALTEAMMANGYIAEDGIGAVEATLKSGLDAGEKDPHPDLVDQATAIRETPQHPECTLVEVHNVFRKWFGKEYDIDVIDAVLATAAAERLAGDPLWLLVISGPGNTKTETVQSLSGAGAFVTSTITSEGALLSAPPRKSRAKTATGGLLRRIGDRGVLVIKDVTSILSADSNTRAGVLAALREVYDGKWERNVGTDGGQTLTWTGRIAVVGAVTTAWDAAHGVVSVMGDRFVSVRSDSTKGRSRAGLLAINNTGKETIMRAEIAVAVGGLIGHIDPATQPELEEAEKIRLNAVADIVTYVRTAVERDYRGDVIDSHAPEMPTRFGRQLAQMMRGGIALGMSRGEALRLTVRCARDSIPQLRLKILLDLASNPRSRAANVCQRITKPHRTVRRELEALNTLELLHEEQEQSVADESRIVWRYSLAEDKLDRATLITMVHPVPF